MESGNDRKMMALKEREVAALEVANRLKKLEMEIILIANCDTLKIIQEYMERLDNIRLK